VPPSAKSTGRSFACAVGLLDSRHSEGCLTACGAGWPTQAAAVTTASKMIQKLHKTLDQYRWYVCARKPSYSMLKLALPSHSYTLESSEDPPCRCTLALPKISQIS
jgi:hypothetical protein